MSRKRAGQNKGPPLREAASTYSQASVLKWAEAPSCMTHIIWRTCCVYRSEWTVWPRGIMSTKLTPIFLHPTTEQWPLLPLLKRWPYTASEEKLCDAIPLTFCLQFQVMDPCFIPSDEMWQEALIFSFFRPESKSEYTSQQGFVIVGYSSRNLRSTNCEHRKASVMWFTLRLVANSSASRFLAVIRRSFPTSSSARWSSARVTRVTELRMASLRNCSSWSPTKP
jgi:hypothetical protein